jgi:hypothetical protein
MYTCKGCNVNSINDSDSICDSCSDYCNKSIRDICSLEGITSDPIKILLIDEHNKKSMITCDNHVSCVSKDFQKKEIYYGDETCVYCDLYESI